MIRGLLLAALLTGPAAAHDWYPRECCSSADCRPRVCDVLETQRNGGILDAEFGQTYAREQVRPSPDGKCHICTGAGADNGRPICVFILQGS